MEQSPSRPKPWETQDVVVLRGAAAIVFWVENATGISLMSHKFFWKKTGAWVMYKTSHPLSSELDSVSQPYIHNIT